MKPKCLKSGKRMRKMLYFSGLLREDEVVSFKAVYSFLRQNQNVEKRILERMKTHYGVVDYAVNKNSEIRRYYYGILKWGKVFLQFQKDLSNIRKMSKQQNYQ